MIGSCSSSRVSSSGDDRAVPGQRERPLDHGHQLGEVEGLGQIVESAALGRAYRRQERVLRAHHDYRQARPALLEPGQQIEGVLVGQHHVEDHHLAGAVLDPAPQRRRRAGRLDAVALARERARDHRADAGVVVGHDHGRLGHHSLRQLAVWSLRQAGSRTRNAAPRSRFSNSTTPPWSPTILATSDRPSPVPEGLLETNGSNR